MVLFHIWRTVLHRRFWRFTYLHLTYKYYNFILKLIFLFYRIVVSQLLYCYPAMLLQMVLYYLYYFVLLFVLFLSQIYYWVLKNWYHITIYDGFKFCCITIYNCHYCCTSWCSAVFICEYLSIGDRDGENQFVGNSLACIFVICVFVSKTCPPSLASNNPNTFPSIPSNTPLHQPAK